MFLSKYNYLAPLAHWIEHRFSKPRVVGSILQGAPINKKYDKNILITGGAGYIGSHIAEILINKKYIHTRQSINWT